MPTDEESYSEESSQGSSQGSSENDFFQESTDVLEDNFNPRKRKAENQVVILLNAPMFKKPKKEFYTTNVSKKIKTIRESISIINNDKSSVIDSILLNDNIDIKIKAMIVSKIENSTASDRDKIEGWAKEVGKLPLGIYKELPVNNKSSMSEINNFLLRARKILDETVFGMDSTKEELIDFLTKFITDKTSNGTILGLESPPGCGKTQICRALSKILCLPFHQLSFGGLTDPATLTGHDLTYTGSKCGKIAQILKKSECMNPIIYMDEIDKIGASERSRETHGVLTHLLDETQNNEFEDNFFQDIPLDLSKVLFICSFNNVLDIDTIVLDRIKVVKLKELSLKDKVVIVKDYILPKINFHSVVFPESLIEYIITEKTKTEPGLRGIKKNITSILNKINTMVVLETCKNSSCIKNNFSYSKMNIRYDEKFRILISKELVDAVLKENSGKEPWRTMYC